MGLEPVNSVVYLKTILVKGLALIAETYSVHFTVSTGLSVSSQVLSFSTFFLLPIRLDNHDCFTVTSCKFVINPLRVPV